MSPRTIHYQVPGYSEYLGMWSESDHTTFSITVDEQSVVQDILDDFSRIAGPDAGPELQVAYIPKDAALENFPFGIRDREARFDSLLSRLKYLSNTDKISTLDLCDPKENKFPMLQLCIRRHISQPEFLPPGEERDHARIIEYVTSNRLPPPEAAWDVKEEQALHPIHNGRPEICTGFPIVMYDEIFAGIVDDLTHLPDRPVNENNLDPIGFLAIRSADTYPCAFERARATYPQIETLLNQWLLYIQSSGKRLVSNEGEVFLEEDGAIYFHVDCRNEPGLGGIPGYQGPHALLKRIVKPEYASIRSTTCCPCIHMSILGPYISFAGSVLTDTYNYQTFTDYIYVGDHPLRKSHIYDVAKIFDIFRNAVENLRNKYWRMKRLGPTGTGVSRLLPQPAYLPGTPVPDLAFEGRIIPRAFDPRVRHAVFRAQYNGKCAVVKFCHTYHCDAHRAVADAGLAPKLYFHTLLRGGMHMVVMERIGVDAGTRFGSRTVPDDVRKQVGAALAILHERNLVHGDVHRSNVLVEREPGAAPWTYEDEEDSGRIDEGWRAYLIDFKLVGEEKKDRFPVMPDRQPRNGRPGDLMEKYIDICMLRAM